MSLTHTIPSLQPSFDAARTSSRRRKKKSPPPFSLRLNPAERERLEQAAAGRPLGVYVRERIFDGDLRPQRRRGAAPVKDHAALAQLLGVLGQMRAR
jgi:hypothetical protein